MAPLSILEMPLGQTQSSCAPAVWDAESWFSAEFAGERIVRFADLLYVLGGRPIHLAVELKARGIEAAVWGILSESPLRTTVTVTSSELENLRRMREVSAEVRLGYLTRKVDESSLAAARSVGVVQLCPDAAGLDAEQIRFARLEGLEVRCWNSLPSGAMENAAALGVDGMTVDFPGRLVEYLADRRLSRDHVTG